MKKFINYIIIFLFSFLMSNIVANNVSSIKIEGFHIHHWMWGLVILLLLINKKEKKKKNVINSNKDYLIAIFLGIVMEGLSYSDRFIV